MGPAMAMEKVLAPRVVRPPWASSRAWNSSTMRPSTVITRGPNRIAPRPTPVGWEQEPDTEGIFRADSTKAKAPHMASRILARGAWSIFFLMEKKPATRKGTHTAPQPMAQFTGSMPSAMCMAEALMVIRPSRPTSTAAARTVLLAVRVLILVSSFPITRRRFGLPGRARFSGLSLSAAARLPR